MNGTWSRTDPDGAKDIFIRDEDSLGLGYFSDLGLTSHVIQNTEWDSSTRVVNWRGMNNQCGILLQDGGYHSVYVGYCYPTVGTPNDITYISIFCQKIRADSLPNIGLANKDIVDQDDDVITQHVVAHELAHGVSIYHHDPVYGGYSCIMRYPLPIQESEVINYYCISNPGCKTKSKLH